MPNVEQNGSLIGLVYSEYLEMPGLQLTLAQAVRLWNSDRDSCTQVLETLVDASFLRRAGGHYVRADSGRICA
jgi:hypothetical protein